MEYMLFICTDPTAPKYVAAEDNIEEWGAEMEARGVSPSRGQAAPRRGRNHRHGARGRSGRLGRAVRGDEGMDRGL